MPVYHSPQQEPGNPTRLIITMVLAVGLIFLMGPLLSRWLPKPPPPAPAPTQQPQAQPQPPSPSQAPAAQGAAAPKPRAPAATAKQAEAEQEIVVENDLYRVTFTNKGAQVKSWVLKKHKDDHGNPLELILPNATQYGLPLSLWTYDEGLRNKLNSALYVVSEQGPQRAPADLSFEFSDGQTRVSKRFRFDHSYVIQLETEVTDNGQPVQAFTAWPAGFGDQTVAPSFGSARVEWQASNTVERKAAKKVSGGGTIQGPFWWAGTADQYFAAIFLPEDPANAALVTLHNPLAIPQDRNKPDPAKVTHVSVLGAALGDRRGPTRARLFVGPKSLEVLDAVHVTPRLDLRGVVDFGWFGIIARPLFLWLRWTHDHWVSNWGWAILILTVIINLALLPLRLASMKSALKMQRISPQMKAIQDKYKQYSLRDPRRQQMNVEMQQLYKREKVNPFGGCLPLLIQMPFLFAFYSMLSAAVELRHAPWLWIRDLSAPDPYFIIPIGIVASTFAMQAVTPMGGMDPAQQRMMKFMMPVMLGAISWALAAGLGLYWVMGNLIGITQQMIMNRTSLGREIRDLAAKRQRKQQK